MATATVEREPQHMIALGRANTIRLARAKGKEPLRAGASPIPYIVKPPEEWQNATGLELLKACRGFSTITARKALRDAGISDARTLGNFTERQKVMLVRRLRQTTMGGRW